MNANLIRPPVVAGTKIIYSVTGESLTGKIKGKVLPIGRGLCHLHKPNNAKDVRLILQTEDSATISCTYTGYLNADEETFKTIRAQKDFNWIHQDIISEPNQFETSSVQFSSIQYGG